MDGDPTARWQEVARKKVPLAHELIIDNNQFVIQIHFYVNFHFHRQSYYLRCINY